MHVCVEVLGSIQASKRRVFLMCLRVCSQESEKVVQIVSEFVGVSQVS